MSYPWPVPKERPMPGEAVNPEDINDAARPILDTQGAIGEHMLANALVATLTRQANYPPGLHTGVLYKDVDLLRDLEDFYDYTQPLPTNVIVLYPNRGYQLVQVWSFTLPYTADISVDASVQVTSAMPRGGLFGTNPSDHPWLAQAAVGMALDGVLCPDFTDQGPDRSAEDYQMTQAQGTYLWAPHGTGIWRDVPPGVHTIAIKLDVSQGHYQPEFTESVNVWSRSLCLKADYK